MKMEGDYPDEMILATVKRHEKEIEREKPLGYQIKIRNKKLPLSDRACYRNVTMRLPEYFTVQEGDGIKPGYLMKNHPEVVLTSGCGTVNFTFDKIADANALNAEKELMDIMSRKYPQNTIYDQGHGCADEQEFYWFDYKSFAMDSDVYNILFLYPCKDETIVGTFKCAFCDYAEWKHYVLKMIATIKQKTKEECQ